MTIGFMLVENLYKAATHHKEHCDENCNVSTTMILQAAESVWRHQRYPDKIEERKVKEMFHRWPL